MAQQSLSIIDPRPFESKAFDNNRLMVRLAPDFAHGLCAEPSSPAANGGLLFGTIEDNLITIQVFRGFEICEERKSDSGPEQRFDKGVGEISSEAAADPELTDLDLIGWYYVRRDESTGFLGPDAQCHNWHFPRETDLLLVLKPEQEKGVSIEFFARSSSAPLSNQQYRCASLRVFPETPVNPPIEVRLEAVNKIDDLPASKSPASNPTKVRVNIGALAHAAGSTRKNKLRWLLLAAAFVFAMGIAFGWAHIRHRYLARPPNSKALGPIAPGIELHVRVEGPGSGVLLSWDRDTILVRSAKHGTLRIDDGTLHRDINLEPSDIVSSSILYEPGSNDVRFRLELRGDHGSAVSNSVRVVDGSTSTPPPAYVPANAVKRVSPNTKSFDPRNIREGAEVDVQVRIDEQGRVVEAHLKSGMNDNDLLRSAALEAAKQWIFEPAKSHGKNVTSDHTLAFQFHP